MGRLKTLIHVHTDYSYDSNIRLDVLADFVDYHQFGCVAITDHDTIEGALRFRQESSARVIIGEEISTREGHLIGLFLQEHIPAHLSALDTARAIRAQGGLVLLPHPFVRVFGCGLKQSAHGIVDWIDAVEINNAQNLFMRPDRLAAQFAQQYGLTPFVGADCHMDDSIAPCHQVLREFSSPQDFHEALGAAELVTGRHSLRYFASTGWRVVCGLTGIGIPSEFGANGPRARRPITQVVPAPAA